MNESVDSPRPLLPLYHREREIGHGEYGVVYLAKYLGTYYALKVVRHPDNAEASRADAYARELRGVRLVRSLPKIDGLVRIHDFAQRPDDSEFAYAMDLADPEREEVGPFDDNYRPRTLASVIDAEIALPLNECLDIGIRIASVLVALQRHHVIHRDIKPGNILFVRGKAVLADIGLVIDVRDAASIVGTPGYAPPERQGSPAGDVFGLGKTLYRISTGRQPNEEGLPPCTEADIDSPYFWKWMLILSKATARDPNRRYRSAKGFLRDLHRLRLKTSATRRIIRRVLAIVGLVFFVAVVVPALWHQPLFYAWLTNQPQMRALISLPYPYSLVQPLLMRQWRSQQAAAERQRQIEREQEEQEKKERSERRRVEKERKRQEEERRRADAERKAEEERKEEEQQKAEEQRRPAERQEEERRKEEERRLAAERQAAEKRRKEEERRLAAEREAEEKRKAQEERERQKEELRQRLEREWRETQEKERKARTERIRQKAERDRRERELLVHEITSAIASLLRPASPLDAVKVSLAYAQVLGVACEYLDYFLDWANLNPDIHPIIRQYYLDRRPIPPPYGMLRPFLVSTNAPPYPYDVLDSDVEMFMQDESLGQVKTIDWSDWSDDEFETGTLRAHLLFPMHGRKRADWNRPRRVIITGDPFLSDEELIKMELEENKTSKERNLDWQMHMRTPLADIIGEDSDD